MSLRTNRIAAKTNERRQRRNEQCCVSDMTVIRRSPYPRCTSVCLSVSLYPSCFTVVHPAHTVHPQCPHDGTHNGSATLLRRPYQRKSLTFPSRYVPLQTMVTRWRERHTQRQDDTLGECVVGRRRAIHVTLRVFTSSLCGSWVVPSTA